MANLNMALCIFGQPRTFEFCFPSFKKHLIDIYHPDIFICTDARKSRMSALFHPIAIEEYTQDEINRRIGSRLDKYGDAVPNPGPYKDYPVKPKEDLSCLYKEWRCHEMVAEYEEKHSQYDVVVGARPDNKFLYIQPITKPADNTLYVPLIDAQLYKADPDGTHWHMGGPSNHFFWGTHDVSMRVLNSYNWVDYVYEQTKTWVGQAMLAHYCRECNIQVQFVNVDLMLIRGSSQNPRACLPPRDYLSPTNHPEYL